MKPSNWIVATGAPKLRILSVALCLTFAPALRAATIAPPILAAPEAPGAFPLVSGGSAAPLHASAADWPGVLRAARDLQADVERVTGVKPDLATTGAAAGPAVVIVGTVGRSALIDGLVAAGKLNVDAVRGKWEAFQIETVDAPMPGVERALVIAGSDKRGTIYGIYEVSEQIGVSPWYWWADVPATRRESLHIRAGRVVVDSPVVRYRGIFLNDEAPALTGWTKEKFGGFNHKFYAHVFELILRLRGNYIWPAMWLPQAFGDDDPENARLADEYGIVVGTSHHEPMMRAHDEWGRYGKGPWDYSKNDEVLREFWRGGYERSKNYETITTLGMRGDGDEAMGEETNVALLERIVADQRAMISEISGKAISEVPQLWALYKEVQGYYERGMRVPDDVTLLWCDDNWGNIRRLPTPAERARPGGAGVYYHFDYVGGPRNYKWINVTPITKVWEQMHLAWQHDANRIWIVNVGDLKPMEFPIEFFFTYAWAPARLPYEKLGEYSRKWAAQQFGAENAAEIAALIDGYSKLNRRRTPEMLAPETYSLVHYREAERVLAAWRDLVARAKKVEAALAPEFHDAFFQLVRYPVEASANVHELYVAAGLNKHYAVQGRAAANTQAARVSELAAVDAALTEAYHTLNGGKWNHQMSQIKFGYTYWQTPTAEVLPAVSVLRPNRGADPALAVEGFERAWPVWGAPQPAVPAIDSFRKNTRWIELFNRGDTAFTFTATASEPWLRVEPASGSVDEIARIEVGADWAAVPAGVTDATVTLKTDAGREFRVRVPVENRASELPTDFRGSIEADGVVSIEAPHFSREVRDAEIAWKMLPDHGRELGGVTAFPVTATERTPGGGSPRLEYDFFLFSEGELKVELFFAPSLDFQSGEGLRFAVSVDDAPPQVMMLDTWKTMQTWEQSVGESVRRVMTTHPTIKPGRHVLKFWMVTPGVVLQKIVIEPQAAGRPRTSGVKPSYLGPPASPRIAGPVWPWHMAAEAREQIQRATNEDHADMMRQLGIARLRPGKDPSAVSSNLPNFDEARANIYPDWPELLVAKDGTAITTPEAWWTKRRPEIVEDFEREVVGRVPENAPAIEWEVVRAIDTEVGGLPVVARQVVGRAGDPTDSDAAVEIKMAVVLPLDARGPVPVLMMFGWGGMPDEPAPRFPGMNEPPAPPSTEQLIAAGWGYVSIDTGSIQADNGAGLASGVIGLANRGQRRTPEQWGALRAWAWGASRALDYLETVPEVDAKRVGIEGVSRYGKAALVAMALEPRFAVALVASAGEGGVSPYRRDFGEALENLTSTYAYHWMAGNFIKYAAADSSFGALTANDLPIEAHQLIALCAPRPVFISYGIPERGDALWLDQQGSYMATVAASPAWRLLGAKDFGVTDDYRTAVMPSVNKGLLDGELAWRQHDGGHESRSNMSFFLGWANRLLKHWPPSRPADKPVMRLDRTSHLAHADLLAKARHGGTDLYFIGDSITRRWGATDYPDFLAHWRKTFHGWNAGDFAWGADSTQHMLWRLDNGELDGLKPKVFVILAGTNNLGRGADDAKVADVTRGITAIVEKCRESVPSATIIVMGILPRNDVPDIMPAIDKINANIARLADGKAVRSLNINHRLADASGTLFEGVTVDKLHLSLKGYEIWADALTPLLTEILGPPAATDTAPPPTGDPSAAR
ncbi:MAG TPA: glycosyl hydrolase 115 family protein [Opitutaceae bacterium]|nr:glycosyl hydrolase 115 family protein [Opitutaceae bacterium]